MKRICPYLIAAVLAAGCAKHEEAAASDEATPTVVTVQTNALKLATLHRYIQEYGTVGPTPASTNAPSAGATLCAPTPGIVARIAVVEGQHVEKGDLLMELNSGTITLENAEQEAARQRQLYAQQNTSLKNLQSAEAQLALLRVSAPLSGTVTRINVNPGQAVDVTTVVAELVDLSRLAVSAQIPAAEAGKLRVGEPVELLTDPPVTTSLGFVSPAVDPASDTVWARAPLPADSGLRPGQFVPLRIVTDIHTNCLAAPDNSVVTDEGGRSVIALVHGDQAAQTNVQTGLREDGWVEITGPGLQPGDAVVTAGAYGLPEKTKIRIQGNSAAETSTNSPNVR